MKFGVIVFPGSNCDHDAYHVVSKHVGQPVDFVWHKQTNLSSYDALIVPGGFSYGDYLRAGALAKFSPVMSAVKDFAASGKYVFGVCNGFQILCEAGLLPGALMRNRDLHFICQHVNVRVENAETPYTTELETGEVLSIPIAHAEGNYVCDDETLAELEAKTMELANKIAEKAPIALQLCKEAVKFAAKSNLDEGLRREVDLFAICFSTEDKEEGVAAFLEKRKPNFKGR